jgi:formate/nitrite transporter FocA (FNT family)
MYYISAGLFQNALNGGGADAALNVGNFLGANLLPVTIGNIIGGALFVGVIYWCVYLKKAKK